jgi:tetratricopeptide (TPR) repeat protein
MEYEDNLESILNNIPSFQASRDPEGKEFSGRLLDNIFMKGDQKEIELLCQFSALFGTSSLEIIRQLPAFDIQAFETLVKRRRFIQRDKDNLFHSHAMIKDFAYEKLQDKEGVHGHCARLFEDKLFGSAVIDSEYFESATNHYKRVSQKEFQKFGFRVGRRFDIQNIKSLIRQNTEDTIRNYRNLILFYPGVAAYYIELGMAYRENKQKRLAIETFRKVIEDIDPQNLHAHNELGITYRENNQKQLAIETFQKVIKRIDARNVHSWNELGITYRENNQKQLAIETFTRVIEEINPMSVHAYTELGITYRENNQKQLAVKAFKKVVDDIEPNSVHAYNELGITYRENNEKELAIETFRKVIEDIDSRNVHSYNELGITYRENNQIDQAIQSFEVGIGIESKNRFFLLSLLQTYLFFLPDRKKASYYYERLVGIEPYLKAFKSSKRVYSKLVENLDLIWTFAIHDPKLYDMYCYHAISYKAYHKVIDLLFEIVNKYPENLKAYTKLGRTLCNEVIDRKAEGKEYLLRVIALYQDAGNTRLLIQNIFYYLHALLGNEEFQKLSLELKKYRIYIKDLSPYYRLLGEYYIASGKNHTEVVGAFSKASELADTEKDLRQSNAALLEYLLQLNEPGYEAKIMELKHLA